MIVVSSMVRDATQLWHLKYKLPCYYSDFESGVRVTSWRTFQYAHLPKVLPTNEGHIIDVHELKKFANLLKILRKVLCTSVMSEKFFANHNT